MPKVTLATVLTELKKIEAKNDDRFELIKQEFQSVHSEMGQFRSEVNTRFLEVNVRLDKVENSIESVATQTAKHIKGIDVLSSRVSKLEGPNA